MPFLSSQFVLLVLATAILAWLTRRTRFSPYVLFAGGIAFFAASPATTPSEFTAYVPLAAFLLSTAITIFGIWFVSVAPAKDRPKRLWLPLILLTALLTTVKVADAPWTDSTALHFALPLGISYYVLRAIAALVEASRGNPPGVNPSEIAGFLGFAPILTVGPIERASTFVKQWREAVPARQALALACQGVGRIIEGLFKIWILCKVLEPYASPMLGGNPGAGSVNSPWISLYAYSLYLYLNFSAASDLAIGVSRFFGVKIAENFDIPYARANISDFWRAWHVSLSTWLRDFLFFPIGKRLPRPVAPILAPLLVMSLCGLWHGLTAPFLLWGLLHGVGLAVHQLWIRLRRANATVDNIAASRAGRTLGAVVTAHFVALTWVFFASPDIAHALAQLQSLLTCLTSSGLVLAYGIAVVALWSFIPDLRDALRRAASSSTPTMGHHLASLWRAHVDLVFLLVLLARFFLGSTQPTGAFVYQGF